MSVTATVTVDAGAVSIARFMDAQDAVFRHADIQAAFSVDAPPPLFKGIPAWRSTPTPSA